MMKNVYGDQCMSCTRYYEWFKQFKDGRQLTHDELHLGRPSTFCDDPHVAQVCEIVHSNRPLRVWEIAEECNILIGLSHFSPDRIEEVRGNHFLVEAAMQVKQVRHNKI
jgi:hypothetical protein